MMREEVSYSSQWDQAGLPFSLPEEYDRLARLVTVSVNGRGFIDYQEVQQTCKHPTPFFMPYEEEECGQGTRDLLTDSVRQSHTY